jgi:hypothetical protein
VGKCAISDIQVSLCSGEISPTWLNFPMGYLMSVVIELFSSSG